MMCKSTLMQPLCVCPYLATCTETLPFPHHNYQQIADTVVPTCSRLCVGNKLAICCQHMFMTLVAAPIILQPSFFHTKPVGISKDKWLQSSTRKPCSFLVLSVVRAQRIQTFHIHLITLSLKCGIVTRKAAPSAVV